MEQTRVSKSGRKAKLGFVAIGLAVPVWAAANSAMTPLYGIGDDSWWFVYVLLIYIFELAFINGYFKVSLLRAAYVALVANLFSAFMGLVACMFWMGSGLGQANPLIEGIKILVIGGVISAIFEAGVWQMLLEPRLKGLAVKQFVRPALLAHAGGVVIGIILLLAQPNPFLGAAQNVNRSKKARLLSQIKQALEMYVENNDAMPPGKDVPSWLAAFEKDSKKPIKLPEFVRFDRLGRRKVFDSGLEVNLAATGRPFKELAAKKEWVIGWKRPTPLQFYARTGSYSKFGTRR